MDITTEINNWIERFGNERDALNVALTRLTIAAQEVEWLKARIKELESVIDNFDPSGLIGG